MGIRILIDQDENTKSDIAEYLREIAIQIEWGQMEGEGWKLDGDEDLPEPDTEPEDFTGATPGDR